MTTDPTTGGRESLGERLIAWSENEPNADYFFGGDGGVFAAMQADCFEAGRALLATARPDESLGKELLRLLYDAEPTLSRHGTEIVLQCHNGSNVHEIYDALEAAIAASPSSQTAGVAEGFVMVPVEPTEAMVSAGESAATFGIGKPTDADAVPFVWRAMIRAAAPQSKEPE